MTPRAQPGATIVQTPEQPRGVDEEGVILEFTRIGALVRVSAMDTKTLTEVIIQGPVSAGEARLREVVLKKLDHALRRQRG